MHTPVTCSSVNVVLVERVAIARLKPIATEWLDVVSMRWPPCRLSGNRAMPTA